MFCVPERLQCGLGKLFGHHGRFHQDFIVLNRRLEELVRDEPPLPAATVLLVEELAGRNLARAREIREGWRGLRDLKKRWRELKAEL